MRIQARGRRIRTPWRSLSVRLTNRIVALLGGRRVPARQATARQIPSPPGPAPYDVRPAPETGPGSEVGPAPSETDPVSEAGPALEAGQRAPGGPVAALGGPADPCGPSRVAVNDACSLADRMQAVALAEQERLREARYAYDQHAERRERAAAAADPRAVRAAKDEAQAAFRAARLAARERGMVETAAREWLREIDRVNATTREAVRHLAREAAAEADLLQAVERLGLQADGARIAAESADVACRNARSALAACEESGRGGIARPVEGVLLAPSTLVARVTPTPAAAPRGAGPGHRAAAPGPTAPAAPAEAEPAVLPLLSGDRNIMRRIAAALAEGDVEAEMRWQGQLTKLVDAVRARAIDGAALTFPYDGFWALYSQLEGRGIAAALAALGYRYDGRDGFADGRVPGQRDLSLAIGYAGLEPMRIRIWPSEQELPRLYAGVQVDAGRFVAEAAGELMLGEMIDLLGRRAEELSDLWNAWGRVRPLLLSPA